MMVFVDMYSIFCSTRVYPQCHRSIEEPVEKNDKKIGKNLTVVRMQKKTARLAIFDLISSLYFFVIVHLK